MNSGDKIIFFMEISEILITSISGDVVSANCLFDCCPITTTELSNTDNIKNENIVLVNKVLVFILTD